jgi:hypothetical protein
VRQGRETGSWDRVVRQGRETGSWDRVVRQDCIHRCDDGRETELWDDGRETMVVRRWSWDDGRETGCDVSNRMSDRCVRYRMFITIIEFCVILCIWMLSFCIHRIGQIVKPVDMLFVTFKGKTHGRILLARLADRSAVHGNRHQKKQWNGCSDCLISRSFLSICFAQLSCTLTGLRLWCR